MAMGMGLDEFWNCSPKTYRFYREADRIQTEKRNTQMWLQGWYVFKAIETALHNQPAYTTKPVKPINYLQEPVRITPMSEAEQKAKEEEDTDKLVKQLSAIKKAWESKHGGNTVRPRSG